VERLGQRLREFIGDPGKHVVAGIIWRGIEELADDGRINSVPCIVEVYISGTIRRQWARRALQEGSRAIETNSKRQVP
jgi:hypothetical protein